MHTPSTAAPRLLAALAIALSLQATAQPAKPDAAPTRKAGRQGRRREHPRQRRAHARLADATASTTPRRASRKLDADQRRQREGPRPGLVATTWSRRAASRPRRWSSTASCTSPPRGASCTRSTCAPASGCGPSTRRSPREGGYKGCCDVVNRGVALYQGKVFVGALRRPPDRARRRHRRQGVGAGHDRRPQVRYTITGAPRVFKGKVIIGNGGAEYGVRGYVTAYDADDRRAEAGAGSRCRATRPSRFEDDVDGQGRQDLGPDRQVLGGRRRRHGVGHDGLRPRAEPDVHRHRQRLARGRRASAARPAATTCTWRRSSR